MKYTVATVPIASISHLIAPNMLCSWYSTIDLFCFQ